MQKEIEKLIMGAASNDQNPFVVNLIEESTQLKNGQILYIEYANRQDLEHFRNQIEEAPTDEIVQVFFRNIAESLNLLKRYKLNHFDIKPANLFVHDTYLENEDDSSYKLQSFNEVIERGIYVKTGDLG